MQRGYYALSLSAIRDHQWEALLEIAPSQVCYPLVMWGVYEPRKYKHLYTFHINFLDRLRKQGKKSINQKELVAYREKEMFVPIEKEHFDISEFWSKIVYG